MTNKLIEATLNFVENSNILNGNLRSGIVKEAKSPFPAKHVDSALKVIDRLHGGISSQDYIEAKLRAHAQNLGYEGKDVQNFADYVHGVHADKTLPNKD